MKPSILILLSFFTLFSCTKPAVENATPIVATPTNDLFATWILTEFRAGFPPYYTYNGEIKWVFNANNTVDVVILSGTNVSAGLPLNAAGNYTYSLNGSRITLSNKAYNYLIVNNKLTIEDLNGQAADGRKLIFNR
jgi:hypothetical protein